MNKRIPVSAFFLAVFLLTSLCLVAQKSAHTFELSETEFLLDGKPYQIISGEIHPARVPAEYWQHRIRMAKAMGCNTIGAYIFWNYHEPAEGVYDFSTGNHNLREFFQTVKDEGMWLILRSSPVTGQLLICLKLVPFQVVQWVLIQGHPRRILTLHIK